MNRLTKAPIIGGLITVAVLIAVIIGCSDDIVVPDLPTLLGNYQGVYEYTTNLGATNQQTKEYPITWRFSDRAYWMWNAENSEDSICSPSGEYVLANGVEIIQKEEGCAGVVSDPELNPTGAFSLRQPGDSIVLMQITDDVSRTILLVPTDN